MIKGELLKRIRLNRQRMRDNIYYSDLFTQGDGWPGDFQGRAILSLCSLYHALDGYKEEQEDILLQLEDIFSRIEKYTNEYKYFGDVFNNVYVDEQQVSGNSWYLRGLVSYYEITKDEKIIDYIKSITKHFLLKIASFYDRYEVGIRENGGVGGHLMDKIINSWKVSSDIGCCFIMIDGMSSVYHLTKDVRLKEVLEKIIEKFLATDFVSLKFQTHATLSCARGILQFYKDTKEHDYLEYTKKILDVYLKYGITKDYANINWFGREDTWTEPCCIVDSIILSKQLYELTRDEKYLNLYNRVTTNAIRTFQRNNGGAGCSTCSYNNNVELKVSLYEAFFCCTMRFGEGLNEIVSFIGEDEDHNVLIPMPCCYENDDFDLSYDLYLNNKVTINIKKVSDKKVKIRLPQNKDGMRWLIVPCNELKEISFDIEPTTNIENKITFYGDMIMTRKKDTNDLSYIYDNSNFTEEELEQKIQYVY